MKRKFYCSFRALPTFALPTLVAASIATCTNPAKAVDVWWDRGAATNAWGTAGNWSATDAAAAATGALPGTADVAVFNITGLNTAQTIDMGADRTLAGLRFVSTGTVLIQGGGTARVLTLGGSGITKTGTGGITIGSVTGTQAVSIALSADQTWANNDNTGALSILNGVTSNVAGARILTLGGTSIAQNAISGIIGNGSGTVSVVKSGTGTWVLSGVNTYTGSTTLSAGLLRATNSAAMGTGSLAISGGTLLLSNDTGTNFARPTTISGNAAITSDRATAGAGVTHTLGTLSIGAQTLTINRGSNATSGTGGITFGAATLTGAATFATNANSLVTLGATTLGANTLTKNGAGSMTISGVVSGSKAAGADAISVTNGTLTLSGANTFTGTITVTAGSLQAASPTAFGAVADGTTIQSGAQLNVNGITMTNAEPVNISGAGLTASPQGALTNSSATAAIWTGPVTLGADATIGSSAAGGLTLSSTATVNLGSNVLTIRNSSTGRVFTEGVISGLGSVTINQSGAGDYVPKADHTYSGGTTLTAGLVAVDRDSIGAPGSPTSGAFGTGTLTLAGGQIRSGSGANRTVGNAVTISGDMTFFTVASEKNLTFSGPITLSGGNRTLTANVGTTVAGISTIFSGGVGDGGNNLGLIKAGTGNLILGGANTYTGGTTVNSGVLILSGSLAANTALTVSPSVAAGATFSLANGAANPLGAISTLTLGSANGTTFVGLDLGASSDFLATANAAVANNAIAFNLSGISGFGAGTYNLISAASGLTSTGASYTLNSVPAGHTYVLNSTDSLVSLTSTLAASGNLYWRGNINNSWSAFNTGNTNFFTDSAGTANAQANPGAQHSVVFSATNATGPVISTTLDSSFSIKDLQFDSVPTGVTSVNIAPGVSPSGNTLTIIPASSVNGINVVANAGNVTISAPIVLGADQTWTANATGASLTVSGAVTGTNALTINGLVTLSAPAATSTYSGATTVPNGAILQAGAANSFSANSAVTVNGTGILRINGLNNTIASLSGNGTVQNNHASTGATLTVGDATNTIFSGTLQNGAAANLGFVKNGSGSLTLSGTNTHTGATTINAGSLIMGSPTALNSANAVTLAGTGTFDLNGNSVTIGALTSAVATATITNTSAGTGASTATALNTPSGVGVYVDALTTTHDGNVSTAALITDGTTRKTQIVLTNTNDAAVFTNGANSFSGGLVLTNSATGTRLSPGTITGTPYGTGPIIIGQAATDLAGIFFATAGQTLTNPIIVNTALGTDRLGIRFDATGMVLSGQITANLAPLTFSSNGTGGATLTGKITGSQGLILSSDTSGAAITITLNNSSSNNDYAGDTIIGQNAFAGRNRTVILGAADQLPNGTGTGNVFINTNGTGVGMLNLAGFNETINGLNGNGTVEGSSGTPILTLGGNNASGSFSGIIQNTAGALTLTKAGSGTQTLSGASTFAGPIHVNGGLVAFPSSPATNGPLGNSTAVNLSGGGLSFTATSTTAALNRSVAIGSGTGTIDVISSGSTLTVGALTSSGGNLIKTGPGKLQLTSPTTLTGGAGVSVIGGTLQGGFGTNGIASISVGATGYLAFQNSVAETLTLGSSGTVLNLTNGARLGFELDGLTNDGIIVPTGGGLTFAGGYTFDFFNTGSGVTATTYTLLTAPSGAQLGNYTYTLGDAPVGYNYSFITSDTMVQLQTVAYTPTYWNNTQTTNSWATTTPGTNFTSDATGLTEIGHTPLGTETVIFNTTALVGPSITTTLDGNHTIDSLQFNGAGTPATTSVTISQGTSGTLTLKPASSSGGIAILAGGGNAIISAPVTLDGTLASSQTWKVTDASSTLTMSGNVNFGADVAKSGDGTLILSGTNSGAGDLNLNAGKLHLNSSAALGSGTLSIAAGTSLDNSSGSSLTLSGNGPTNVNGDFTFVGSNSLTLGTGAVTLVNNPTINTTAQTLTVSGAVGGSSALSKSGAGTLLLTAANGYTGLTNINGGVLRITHGAALGTIGAGTAQSGSSALELDGTSGAISVNEPLSINGGGISNAGALRNIAGNNSYAGTISLAAQSRINSDSGTLTLTNPTSVNGAGQTLVVGGLGNTAINGAIGTATGGVIKDGTGVLTLAGANTYVGNTDVRGGVLNLTGSLNGNGTATTGPVLLYGSAAGNTVVNVTGNIVNYLRFTGATVASANAAYIQTSGNVNFTSTGTTDPTNAVATAGYGYMEITGGTLKANGRLAPSNGAGSTGVIYIGGSGTLDHTGGEWLLMSYSASGTGGKSMITVDTGGTLDRVGSTSLFGLNMNRNNGYAVLNIAGGSVLNSNRAITFGNAASTNITGTSGFLNLAAGTLQIGANMVSGNTGAGSSGNNAYLNFSGGTLKAQAALTNAIPVTAAHQTVTSTIYGAINNNGTAHDFNGGLIVDTNTFATTLANNLVAPSSDGVRASSLSITGGSGYIGAPMVEFTGGTLAAGGAPASGYAVVSGGVVTDIVITAPGSYTAAPTVTLTGGGGTGASVAVSTLVANTSGGLTKNNNGVLTLSGANTYTGATVINAGTLQLGSAGTVGSLSPSSTITNNSIFLVNRTNAAVQGTDFGVINGTGSFTQAGTGTTTLNVANGYAGGTSITGGILVAGHANALGAGNVSINGGVSFVVQTGVTISNPITIGTNTGVGGRGLVEAGSTTGTSTVSGPVTINNGAVAGGIFGAPTAGTTLHVQGTITSSVPVTSRLGTVMFSGGGTGYTDLTVGQGTVKVGANNGIATSATVLIAASAAGNLDLNGFNQSLAGIVKGVNAAIIGNSSTTADSVLTTTGTSTYAGIIQDVLDSGTRKVGLTVQSGMLTLTGTANTYTGPTIVNGGTLNIATGSSIATSSLLTVNSGGVLSGSGTLGSTLLMGGSEIRPGNSPGSLTTTGDLTVAGASTFVMDLAGTTPSTGYDQLSVSGAIDLGSTAILSLNVTFAPVEGDKFFLLLNNGASPISGSFNGIAEGAIIASGGSFFEAHYGADSTSGNLTGGNDFALVAVPETSSMLLAMLSVGTLIFRRRR